MVTPRVQGAPPPRGQATGRLVCVKHAHPAECFGHCVHAESMSMSNCPCLFCLVLHAEDMPQVIFEEMDQMMHDQGVSDRMPPYASPLTEGGTASLLGEARGTRIAVARTLSCRTACGW